MDTLRRRRRRTVLVPLLWLVALVAGVAVVLVAGVPGLPQLRSPFGQEEVDRSPPPVLQALQDLSRYQGAQGTYQVVVDVEDDVRHVPSVLAGERTLFLAQGSVEAYVEFGRLGPESIVRSPDGRSVTVTLPPAALSAPRVDAEHSRVVSRERGVLDRVGGVFSDRPTDDRELYVVAEQRLSEAAQAGELRARAEENTRQMLTRMLQAVGYEQVTVVFEPELRS